MLIKKISFEEAMRRNCCVILKGEKIKHIKGSKYKNRINYIKSGIPISFSKISNTIMQNYGYLGYIDFWDKTVEIYKIIC